MSEPVSSETLNEMIDYYKARANEYDEFRSSRISMNQPLLLQVLRQLVLM